VTASSFLDDTLALLERTPRIVETLLDGLPESWVGEPDAPGGWTARDVVVHLTSAEIANWIPRAELILSEGTARPFVDLDRFAQVERDDDVTLSALVERFARMRRQNLERLRELVGDEADLDRRGRHLKLGEVTLRQLLATWSVHDLDHVQQIYAALAGSRDADVGPYKVYLGILTRRAPGS
jgi:DinB superfamily